MDHLCVCLVFVMLSRLFFLALWSPRGKGAGILALDCGVYCDFDAFTLGIVGQVWYLIVSIADPCCLFFTLND